MYERPLPGRERRHKQVKTSRRIAVLEPIHDDAMALLRAEADVVDWNSPEIADWPSCDGVIVRTKKIAKEQLEASSLSVVGSHGTGVDNIDLEAAQRLGITVVNVPGEGAQSVAELYFALMLAVARKIVPGMDAIRSDCAVRTAPAQRGMELASKVLGIAGYGSIGKRIAAIGRLGFGMKVHAWSRSLSKGSDDVVYVHDSLEGLLRAADCICVCLPLTEKTRHIIGKQELALCKQSAILVNCSRGDVVDEKALYDALQEGRLFGAACDVFSSEPPHAGNELLSCPNFVASQHIGINTDDCLRRIGCSVARDVLAVLKGLEPAHRCQ